MRRFLAGLQHLLSELKRRKVYQVAALYCVAAFALLQLADIVLPALGFEDAAMAAILVLVVAGFPVAVLLGWMYDWTETGVRRTPDQEPAGPGAEPGLSTGGKSLAIAAAVAATLLVSIGGLRFLELRRGPDAGATEGSSVDATLDPRRVAVLYFDDHSPGGELAYLADALTEAVIHELGQLEGLQVISRNGVKAYRGPRADLTEITRSLRVGSIVEGSLTPAGENVRVTFQLIDGSDLSHLHSGTITEPVGAWISLNDQVVAEIARALRLELGEVVSRLRRREGNRSDEAWDLVSRASRLRFDFAELRSGDVAAGQRLLRAADSLLVRAHRLDPTWVEPLLLRGYIARHHALAEGPRPGTPDPAWIERALGHAAEALAVGEDRGRALELRGGLRLLAARAASGAERRALLSAAEADLRSAVSEDARLARAWGWLSELLLEQTRFEEAGLAARRAVEADEFLEHEAGALWAMAYSTLQLGPEDAARERCEEGRRRFPEDANFLTCRLMILASFPQVPPDVDAARRAADSLVAAVSSSGKAQFHDYAQMLVATVAARGGQRDTALAIARTATGPETPPWLAYNEAYLNLLLGDTARTLELLRVALDHEIVDSAALDRDWWFDGLDGQPAFAALLGEHSLPVAPD